MGSRKNTWLVLLRDISHAVRTQNEPRIVASLVFHIETGLILASAITATEEQALAQALRTALAKPSGGLGQHQPDMVLSGPGLGEHVQAELAKLADGIVVPVHEVGPVDEAEDIFDNLVGHLAGRRSPELPPRPGDWRAMFHQALQFYERKVWARWADDVDLLLEVEIGGQRSSYSAVVLGHEGIQHGVVLYPGSHPPAGLRAARAGRRPKVPTSTLMFNFDPPQALPAEFAAKAARYGWPASAELVPLLLRVDGSKPVEPAREEVRAVTVALAALVSHDATGPALAEDGPRKTSGKLELAGHESASFSIQQLLEDEDEPEPRLRVHLAGQEMLAPGTKVLVGSVLPGALPWLRSKARLYRPLPPGSPPLPTGELPAVVVVPDEGYGDEVTGRAAEVDPFGIAVAEAEGRAVLVLGGANGAEILAGLDASDPAVRRFRSGVKRAKGAHVFLVADDMVTRGEGTVYGLFECSLPEEPPGTPSPAQAPKQRQRNPRAKR